MNNYKFNYDREIKFTSTFGVDTYLDIALFEEALNETNKIINQTSNIEVDLFDVLGMRNLSAFIGEVFVKSFEKVSNGDFLSNPHQDGYPDLILLDDNGHKLLSQLQNNNDMQSKAPFSPFSNGGLEVKATVGSVPTPKECAKKGLMKPSLGDTRIGLLKNYDWKAHHRETTNLIGLTWDFIDGIPRITAIFFSPRINTEDWSEIIKPKAGGGRTTSVSIMTRQGVKKMYQDWICVIDDTDYTAFFNKYNKDTIL
jgi:hypothetical protein